jgi:hypothetical protein
MNTSLAPLASSISYRSGLRVVTATEAQRVLARAAANQSVIPFQLQTLEERAPYSLHHFRRAPSCSQEILGLMTWNWLVGTQV